MQRLHLSSLSVLHAVWGSEVFKVLGQSSSNIMYRCWENQSFADLMLDLIMTIKKLMSDLKLVTNANLLQMNDFTGKNLA